MVRVKLGHPTFMTSLDENHSHIWKASDRFTSINAGHNHRVQSGTAMPNHRGGHFHTILIK